MGYLAKFAEQLQTGCRAHNRQYSQHHHIIGHSTISLSIHSVNDIWLCNVDCHKKKRTWTIRNETLIYFNILLMIYLQRREKTYLSGEIVASAHGVDEASSSVFGCVKLLQQGAGAPLRNLVFNNNQSVWKQNNSLESSSPKYRQRSRRTQLPSVSGSHNLLFYHNYNTSNITTCCACSLFLF